jgi:glycosyltransferase involved in cell wall biosynthesis
LVGPFKNGGIGTATTGLVETVAAMGCPTAVFYTGGIWSETDMRRWVDAYARIGIEFVAISPRDMMGLSGPVRDRWIGVPHLVYEFARSRRFDIIHFNDTLGEGMLVLAAKRLGLGFQETLLALALHGPTRWAFGLNRQPMDRLLYAAFDWAERVSVRSADLLWGPSRYLIEATKADGWQLPEQVICQQYVMPTVRLFESDPGKFEAADAPPPGRATGAVNEIAFFGRLEERKGLRTFCAALDRVGPRLAAAGVSVTFLGRPMPEDGESTEDWLRRAGASWPFAWRLETGFGQPEAIAYLTSRPLVAVMPSPYDNSPCTVYEAMQHGIPFLAASRGGIPELIDDADHPGVLFDYTVEGLAGALERMLESGVTVARPRFSPAERRRQWRDFHRRWRSMLPSRPASESGGPRRLCVLVDRARDRDAVLRSLASIRGALGDRVAAVIVLATRPLGPLPGVTEQLDGTRISATPSVLAQAIESAEAEWLFCLSSGATIVADRVASLDAALASSETGDGLIPAAIRHGRTGTTIVPAVGGAQAFGYFEGFGFTAAAVLRCAAVLEVLGRAEALPRDAFAGLPDLLVTSGHWLWPFPDRLIEFDAATCLAPVSSDPTRDRAFASIEPLQASMLRWIGAAAIHRPPISRYEALELFVAGRRWGPALLRLYRFVHKLRFFVSGKLRGIRSRLGRAIRAAFPGARLARRQGQGAGHGIGPSSLAGPGTTATGGTEIRSGAGDQAES